MGWNHKLMRKIDICKNLNGQRLMWCVQTPEY